MYYKKNHYKAKYRKIKYNFEKKDKDESEKKFVETLHTNVMRAKNGDNNKHIHLFMA